MTSDNRSVGVPQLYIAALLWRLISMTCAMGATSMMCGLLAPAIYALIEGFQFEIGAFFVAAWAVGIRLFGILMFVVVVQFLIYLLGDFWSWGLTWKPAYSKSLGKIEWRKLKLEAEKLSSDQLLRRSIVEDAISSARILKQE